MPVIRVLPREVVEKIAAGEVVERPASIVKELVENAIDAGASRISVEIEEGGKKAIRVIDDGCGMEPEDLALAVTSHATSKLRSAEDLFRIDTFGFRGEALAAIGAVSHLRILSRVREREAGSVIELRGGTVRPVADAASPVGTRVEVERVFFNVPARRKFLRSAATEGAHVQDWIERFALAYPKVAFFLLSDGRDAVKAFPAESRFERILFVLGPRAEEDLLPLSEEGRDFAVEGAVSRPSVFRTNAKQQVVFVNGRFVRDRVVLHAVRQAYETLVPKGRFPASVLFLRVPPEEVDANVHPTKTEVRFRNSAAVHQFVRHAVSHALSGATGERTVFDAPSAAPSAGGRFRELAASFGEASGRFSAPPPAEEGGESGEGGEGREPLPEAVAPRATAPSLQAEMPVAPDAASPVRFLQVHNMFIVAETPEGIEIFDQHALHERILYDELRAKAERAQVESQQLLIPEVLEFTREEAAALREGGAVLGTLGFQLGDFGENALAVHAAPAMLVGRRLKDFFRLLIERWGDDLTLDLTGLREKMMRLVACQAAVRAGDSLQEDEIRRLLARVSGTDFPGCCQHGRPTSLKIPVRELERKFLRR